MFTQTTKPSSALVTHHSDARLCWISYVDEYEPELHYVEGPLNVIADTFSWLLCSDVSSPLVGKKAAYVDSNSESGNRNESLHSLLMDDRDIIIVL
jgi:hypothetical protein